MKKRALSLLMAFVMVIGLLPATVWAAETEANELSVTQAAAPEAAVPAPQATEEETSQPAPLAAEETVTGEIKVGKAADLAALSGKTVEGNITLTNDIALSNTEMTPIKSLKGCFNGDGHTISGLTLTGGTGNTGLIGELNGSVINLKMTGVTITDVGSNNKVGALVGYIADGSTSKIDNCYVSGSITSTISDYVYIGGLVGYMTGGTDAHTALTINNCVSKIALKGANSNYNYIGGLLGTAQYYSDVTITKCAQLSEISGKGTGGGMIGYISTAVTALTLSDSYLGGKVSGSKAFGIAYNLSALNSISCTNFYYDSTENPSPSSWESFKMLNKVGYTSKVTATAKSTTELKALTIDGFEVRDGEFDGYPVPVWTLAAAPEPIKPPFSCALTFTGVEGGTLTVKHGENTLTANEGSDYSYTLSETGDYSYSVTFGEDSPYNNVAETPFTVGENDTAKNIAVTLTYKVTEPSGAGTEEDPILIGTAAELRAFANKVNSGDSEAAHAYVKLTNDITIPGSWTPLGKNAASPFSGHFDGDNHSVTITVDNPSPSYFGFFGCLDSKADRDSTTPIDDQPTVVVENLTVNGTVYCSEPYAFVGGIAARARGKVEIKNCVNNATVSSLARGSAGVGGLVGGYDDGVEYVYWNICMTLTDCTNNGTISVTGSNTDAMVGGLVGSNKNCVQVTSCANTGTVNAPGCTVGGLLGAAGAQTGDFVPTIKDSGNSGVLLGAAGKTNNLYGKGTIRSGYLINSGSNTYTGGSESEDELLKESQKYNDVLAVPSTAEVGDSVTLLKTGETAAEGITVTCSVGAKDTNRDYLKVETGVLKLAKLNDTGKAIEATATITWSKGEKSLSKPVTVNIYPAANSRKTLMNNIAATYTNSSSDWVLFDMAVYDACEFGENTADRQNYLNLAINELAGNTPLASDRAKAEIIFAALGVDSTKLTPFESETAYSNAAKLAAMDLGSSHYTAPWVLLAEQAGQLELTSAQRDRMIALLTNSSNFGTDGLFFTKWGGETYADPDTTGTALAALVAYADRADVKEFIDKAVAGLSAAQRSNGSYGNVNSDAMVIIGLTALGIDPSTDSRFVKDGCSLADALLLYVNDGGNGFTVTAVGAVNGELTRKAAALATEQGFRALIALEKLGEGNVKAFNIYTLSVTYENAGEAEEPVQSIRPAPALSVATSRGTVPAQDDVPATNEWISVAVSIEPADGSVWYSGSVKVASGATVEQAIKAVAKENDLTLDIKSGYLRSITRGDETLGQFDEGPNSGWMYRVNGELVGRYMSTQGLKDGDSIELYFTSDWTSEPGAEGWQKPGKIETIVNADGSVTKIETKSDGTVIETTTWRDGSTLTVETSPNGRVETVEKRADGTTVETVESASGGITASVSVPKSVGSTRVDIPVSKPAGSMVAVIVHPDGTEEIVKGSIVTETGIALRAEGSLKLKIIDNAKRFSDMADHWAKDAVEFAASRELFNGVGNDAFGPDLSMTRGMVNTVLARLAGADTTGGATWYAKGTEWAVENGISDGTNPEQQVTREQLAAMLYRYAGSPAVSGELSFDDTAVISIWAYDAVKWCVDNGILNGMGGNRMAPQDLAQRGQVAAMLMRFLQATV